jgi:squalene-associated FAD-dependent desaturase
LTPARKQIAVIGAGWAGLAAAVQAAHMGLGVTLFEMAAHGGGRARSVAVPHAPVFDNGQHILIGAYSETLRLMRLVGQDPQRVLERRSLELVYPDGRGLRMPRGPARLVFAWGVLRTRGWSWRERWALLAQAVAWQRAGMRNPGVDTVAQLCARLPERVRADLIDPLCIAALNTPASQASATVFLRVLNDALFATPGGSDLLLPRAGLSQLFPQPALAWLECQGARCHLTHRVQSIARDPSGGWRVDGELFDAVVLACSAVEAARLATPSNPQWAQQAAALHYEPIGTVYLSRGPQALPCPMLSLRSSAERPAQFAFDLGLLGQHPGVVAFVVSGASQWIGRGLDAMSRAVQRQAVHALPQVFSQAPAAPVLHAAMERRATFACTPHLLRPAMVVADGLLAAGDYVEGPYPATLEGSVRAGLQAVGALAGSHAGSRGGFH